MINRQPLPAELTGEFVGEFVDTMATIETTDRICRVKELLSTKPAAEAIRELINGIDELDEFFMESGPGGFWRADVASARDGSRLKVHVFPNIGHYGDGGPHSHSTDVVSAIYCGTLHNRTYKFTHQRDGDLVKPNYYRQPFAAAAHIDRRVTGSTPGVLEVVDQLDIGRIDDNGDLPVYDIKKGAIHTTTINETSAGLVTLCWFGPYISPGARYVKRVEEAAPNNETVTVQLMPRPKEILK